MSILYEYVYQYSSLNGQTSCLNKVIVVQTFAKNGLKMSDVISGSDSHLGKAKGASCQIKIWMINQHLEFLEESPAIVTEFRWWGGGTLSTSVCHCITKEMMMQCAMVTSRKFSVHLSLTICVVRYKNYALLIITCTKHQKICNKVSHILIEAWIPRAKCLQRI